MVKSSTPKSAKAGNSEKLLEGGLETKKNRSAELLGDLTKGLVIAAFAAFGSGAVAFLSATLSRNLEAEKLQWSKDAEKQRRDDDAKLEAFKASNALAGATADAMYEVGSFLESAVNHPGQIDSFFDRHESAMKVLMPKVVAAHIAVANHDYAIHVAFRPLIAEVANFDHCVTEAYRLMTGVPRNTRFNEMFTAQQVAIGALPDRVRVATIQKTTPDRFGLDCLVPAPKPK